MYIIYIEFSINYLENEYYYYFRCQPLYHDKANWAFVTVGISDKLGISIYTGHFLTNQMNVNNLGIC